MASPTGEQAKALLAGTIGNKRARQRLLYYYKMYLSPYLVARLDNNGLVLSIVGTFPTEQEADDYAAYLAIQGDDRVVSIMDMETCVLLRNMAEAVVLHDGHRRLSDASVGSHVDRIAGGDRGKP